MSIQNLVSATLPEQTKLDILAQLSDIRSKLSFLVTLDPDQAKSLFRAGNGLMPFVEKTCAVAKAHPEVVPGFLSLEELAKDVALVESLRPILSQVNELAKAIQDTMVAAGSDSLAQCLEVYAAVKRYSDKVPGLSVAQEELGVFFQRPARKAAPATA